MPTADELERLAETHELTTLTEEEQRLIYAFRLFKDRKHKPGAMFQFQTHPESAGGELPSRIIKPSDVTPAMLELTLGNMRRDGNARTIPMKEFFKGK